MTERRIFSLLEVTQSIQRTLTERYTSSFWIKAEMNKLNRYGRSGHCFPELVEKENGKIIAQLKATLWNNDYERINARFLSVLQEPIKDGIKILICAFISFDPSYGLSLRIIDIDPAFSLGELEREKQETISRLTNEEIYHRNQELELALLPQRIAVISVESSKGYSDYLKIINTNPWGYKFFNFLFPALLQGDKSATSIIRQLKRIRKAKAHFDAVAIIRGGGAEVGLTSYNNYELAREIALFPIPVITGIGHSTNQTVAELVAHRNAITPTELADFLIQEFHNFSVPIKEAEDSIATISKRILREEKVNVKNIVRVFKSVTKNQLQMNHSGLQKLSATIAQESKFTLRQNKKLIAETAIQIRKSGLDVITGNKESLNELVINFQKQVNALQIKKLSELNVMQRTVNLIDPVHTLRRGFSITRNNGKVITNPLMLSEGDKLITQLAEGEVYSNVEKK